ncbi:hypothetical protein COLO4_27502 [Corchorus olitorius]|uniref:Uncharacterized protein n=1 Tax=Corchorus olitorius TaxID=93759 RepID=A0A1R3HQU7_9ROSI|nr:hypothetical protein COLO4_27502 [Corchorus olitorius]
MKATMDEHRNFQKSAPGFPPPRSMLRMRKSKAQSIQRESESVERR